MAKSAKLVALALFVLLTAPTRAQDVVAGKSGEPAVTPPTKAGLDAAGGIRVRVGVPFVARGPGAIADSWFTEVRLFRTGDIAVLPRLALRSPSTARNRTAWAAPP